MNHPVDQRRRNLLAIRGLEGEHPDLDPPAAPLSRLLPPCHMDLFHPPDARRLRHSQGLSIGFKRRERKNEKL